MHLYRRARTHRAQSRTITHAPTYRIARAGPAPRRPAAPSAGIPVYSLRGSPYGPPRSRARSDGNAPPPRARPQDTKNPRISPVNCVLNEFQKLSTRPAAPHRRFSHRIFYYFTARACTRVCRDTSQSSYTCVATSSRAKRVTYNSYRIVHNHTL